MKYRTRSLVLVAAVAAVPFMSGCKSREPEPGVGKVQLPVIGSEVRAMPHAIVYKVSGDNCMDLVPVTLTADGKGLLSYPAPTDLNESQTPIDLGDGWWLDRRGIGPTSVFTTYTYGQYAAMKNVPSEREIMDHIDRHARITRMVSLPITAAEAASDPAVARAYTEGGFVDCQELLNRE